MIAPSERRVLVTGATGFVGSRLVERLKVRDWDVHTVDRFAVNLLVPGVAASLIERVRPSHLVHLAWNAEHGRFWTAADNLDWVAASLALHRAFAAHGGERAVYAGTCAEYDWAFDHLDEAVTPCRPHTLYGVAKDSLRRLLEACPEGVSIAWARLFFLYGPGEAPGRLVSSVTSALLNGREALCGDGEAERDFMHVSDVANALVALLESPVTGPVNIASGVCRPIKDIIRSIAEHTGRPDLVRLGARPSPVSEPPRLAASASRLHHEVGVVPEFDLDDGIADTIRWWREQL
ncbi:MAG TPA: NAD(P)-dependent oxidoreductase [Oscillatoriaceae cyanobacterium]|jgi:nucleoside-diphosphate-sugar epimerase